MAGRITIRLYDAAGAVVATSDFTAYVPGKRMSVWSGQLQSKVEKLARITPTATHAVGGDDAWKLLPQGWSSWLGPVEPDGRVLGMFGAQKDKLLWTVPTS